MANLNEASIVKGIKYRMSTVGIDLDKHIVSVINVWDKGFRFNCKNTDDFAIKMISNQNFCADSSIGGSQHSGASWREAGKSDSMHIIISKKYCEVHIDTINVVSARHAKTRQCVYHYGNVLDHLVTDLKRWPVIIPTSERGIKIGIRF